MSAEDWYPNNHSLLIVSLSTSFSFTRKFLRIDFSSSLKVSLYYKMFYFFFLDERNRRCEWKREILILLHTSRKLSGAKWLWVRNETRKLIQPAGWGIAIEHRLSDALKRWGSRLSCPPRFTKKHQEEEGGQKKDFSPLRNLCMTLHNKLKHST